MFDDKDLENDRERISNFIEVFKDALDRILTDPLIRIDRETLGEIKKVLPEMNSLASDLKNELLNFNSANRQEIDAGLELHGLTGSQLSLKLSGFDRAFISFRDVRWWHKIAAVFPGVFSRAKWAERLLRWANIVLGSLSQVFPAAGALDEFKQVVEAAIAERKSWT